MRFQGYGSALIGFIIKLSPCKLINIIISVKSIFVKQRIKNRQRKISVACFL